MNAHLANAALRRGPADAAGIRAAGRRTLEVERAGLGELLAAMDGPLGEHFVEAVETIHAARGRLIVTGMGKSGHVGAKITATLASTGTPCFFLHPAEASHGDLGHGHLGRRDPGAVLVGRDGRAARHHPLLAPPPGAAGRHHLGRRRARWARRPMCR